MSNIIGKFKVANNGNLLFEDCDSAGRCPAAQCHAVLSVANV